ncbi:MAG: aspartyl protease family protein [Planctomycetia bacterium]
MAIVAGLAVLVALQAIADDVEDPLAPRREHPPHGTQFWFEVVESFNAKYEGDTPGHIGRGGGITHHPHVALGDMVHHRIGDEDKQVGIVTGVTWDRLKGSLTVEFRPREDHRIAVGDEVWVDLNPAPQAVEIRGTAAPDQTQSVDKNPSHLGTTRQLSIPFEISATGTPLVTVTCGKRTLRMIVDTAAEANVLTPAATAALGLAAQETSETAAGLGASSVAVSRLRSVALSVPTGTFDLEDLAVLDLSVVQEAGGEGGVDGLLGSPFFRQHDAQIDYATKQLRFTVLRKKTK